jgi:hypothetical protein
MAKPATKPAPTSSTKPMAKDSKAVGFVSPAAMSADVGQKAMEAFRVAKETDAEISTLQANNTARKYETLKSLTQSFCKAALHDKTINLADIHSEEDKTVAKLRTKLEVAVGIKQVAKTEDGTDRFSLSDWTADYLPQVGEDKTTAEWRRKENFRTNFAPVFKKAIQSAHAILLKDLKISEDKDGALMVEGKAIKERFNVDKIALNEKREIKDGEKTIKLAKIPSYTELARISAESAGKTIQTRVQSAAKMSGNLTEADVLNAVKTLTTALGKMKNFGDELATAMEALQDTIEQALSRNEGGGSE